METFERMFRDGGLIKKNIFIEKGITDEDISTAMFPGGIVLSLLHGSNKVWELGETPDEELEHRLLIIKGDESSEETLDILEEWGEKEINYYGYTLDGRDIDDFIMETFDEIEE